MEELIKVIILGIVEGITEFLPISSTGHLLVTSALLNSEVADRLQGTFEIFIQIGAVLAVVAYYRNDLLTQVRTVQSDPAVRRLWLSVIVASIPAAVLGFLLRDFIKDEVFPQDRAPFVVAVMLIIGGFVFLFVERNADERDPEINDLSEIGLRNAFLIGLAQAFALIPGVSRSGASIVGGLLIGVNRKVATAFSFYLAIPVLGGATLVDLVLSLDELSGDDLTYLAVGAIISGIVAWIAIDWLLKYVASNSFVMFGYYRIIAGAIILLLLILGVL